ncbi:coenzyme F420-0:L-glutamate ligase [Candidatus Peregrinibacteria bacterium]|nr:coenzyme F420-0:L-glutamate ligase [Candidatus Peregrinibacteria bacterium]
MELIPLKSKLLKPESDLSAAVLSALKAKSLELKEKDVLAVASKAVAYAEGRLVYVANEKIFRDLVRRESDALLDEGDMVIALKNKILIPNAGIDRSNTPKGYAVLWPKDPFKSARAIREKLKKKFGLKRLGVVLTDSHCQPLRAGVSGIAIGWAGFEGVFSVRGKKDLFGKKMRYTQINAADDLASAANLLMGETDARIPFVIVRGFDIKFTEKPASSADYFISPKRCIFRSLYTGKLS